VIKSTFIRKIGSIRMALSRCYSRDDVEEVFSENNISDNISKTVLLRRCMQMEKMDYIENDNDYITYNAYLDIFLTGKWRDVNSQKETTIPELSESIKTQRQGQKKISNQANAYADLLDITKEDYKFVNNFYEKNILPRIRKKYLAKLISVIEDMIDEKQKKDSSIKKMERYKIILTEITPELKLKTKTYCLLFPYHAVILYDPNVTPQDIRIMIAHELGNLLSHFKIINNRDVNVYANLFAFFALRGEENFYTSEYNCPLSENELIKRISEFKLIEKN